MAGSFDVFFSYATADHAAVERVARALHDRGIRVFLDRWYLTPGLPWPQALERTLAACNAVAVFIGAEGLGPWQQRERDLALDRQGRELRFPVIPVLLTSSDPGLGFLRLNTWVDLTKGPDDAEALAILAGAIRGEPPGPLDLQQSASVRAAVCPYRGLRPFREEDEPFFFGRATFAETLTATALRQPFVAVLGASGSGKSSVVRAGLLPRLRRGAGALVWDALTLVPTDRPLHSLAAALLPMLEPDLSEVDRLAEVGKLAGYFAGGTVPLRDVAERVLARQPGTDRLLLFVDQWEELYTLCADEAVRGTFIDLLLQASASERVRVVLTLRGDFMGHALANRALVDRLQDAVVTIGPMTRDELAETIIRPAEKTGLGFEAGLAETILDEVGEEPGTLPLLEFLLEGLWAARRGNLLTHDAYARLGRVSGAIAQRAEAVFKDGLSDKEREAAQRLLVRMVRPGEGVEDTRRRTALPVADAVAEATIRKLAAERLVVTERDASSGEVTVEVAHEALIRRWQRLRDWVDRDRDFLRLRERIASQATTWADEASRPTGCCGPGDRWKKERSCSPPARKTWSRSSSHTSKRRWRRKRRNLPPSGKKTRPSARPSGEEPGPRAQWPPRCCCSPSSPPALPTGGRPNVRPPGDTPSRRNATPSRRRKISLSPKSTSREDWQLSRTRSSQTWRLNLARPRPRCGWRWQHFLRAWRTQAAPMCARPSG